MYDHYSLLQSLKNKKFSRIVNIVRYRILKALQQDYFSPKLKDFFPTLDLQVEKLETLKPLYVELMRADLPLDERTRHLNVLRSQRLPFAEFDLEPAQVSQVKKILNALYFGEMILLDIEGLALDGDLSFSHVFSQASDVNTLYNQTMEKAYYAAYLITHVDVELRGVFSHELSLLSPLFQLVDQFVRTKTQNAMGYAYGYSLSPWIENTTRIEPGNIQVKVQGECMLYRVISPLGTIITDELTLSELNPDFSHPVTFEQLNLCFSKILELTSHRGHTKLKSYDQKQVAYLMGVYSGFGIEQLNPKEGADYQFLTQFTAEIPRYLDEWSKKIQAYSELASAGERSHLDPHQLETLRNHALLLLHAIENLQDGSFFFSVKVFNYLRIFHQLFTLSLSIIEEANHLNETAQASVCSKMEALKYLLSTDLLAAMDKLEEATMLRPGFLSSHLKQHLQNFYDTIVHYTNKYVDFSKRQPHLLTLEDTIFHAARLERAHQRMSKIKVELLCLEQIKFSLNKFFSLLKQPHVRGMRLKDLPELVKQELASHYHLIQPYIHQTNLVDSDLVASLTSQASYSFNPRRLISWVVEYNDSISFILRSEQHLLALVGKEVSTNLFQFTLNQELIQAIQTNASLTLLPCEIQDGFNLIDEATVLGIKADETDEALHFELQDGHNLVQNLEELSSKQTLALYRFYSLYQAKLADAMNAYEAFSKVLERYPATQIINDLPVQPKQELRNLYAIFQPYWVHLFAQEHNSFPLDDSMVMALSINSNSQHSDITAQDFFSYKPEFIRKIRGFIDLANEKKIQCSRLNREALVIEQATKPLDAIKRDERANHVISHTEYSKAFRAFKESLEKFTSIFNAAVRRELKPAKEGIPFPELGVSTGIYSQSSQVLMLKRLINAAYHLEQLFIHLETLHDKSIKSVYVMRIGRASVHVYNLVLLTNALCSDPYTVQMAGDIVQKLKFAQNNMKSLLRPYLPGMTDQEEADRSTMNSSSESTPAPEVNQTILHVLNAMMVLPEHIKAGRQGEVLERSDIQSSHENAYKIAQDIQRIIKHSSSYLKLFFETSTMYKLFKDLRVKLEIVTTSTHDAVMDNLKSIRNELMLQILLEANHWEDKFALLPGTVSQPLRDILDAFFIGMIESLELPTQQHLSLVQSMIPIELEMKDASNHKTSIGRELKLVKDKEVVLQRFSKQVQVFKDTIHDPGEKEATCLNLAEALVDDFNHFIVPVAQKVCLPFTLEELSFHELPVSDVVTQDKLLASVEEILSACVSHYHELHASHQLAIDTIDEKIHFLQDVKKCKETQDKQYITDYATKLFNEQAKLLSSKHFGLIHSEVEYREELYKYLKSFESEIVSRIIEERDSLDIRKNLVALLSEKIRQFEQEHYEDYKQLNNIKAAIEQFRSYIGEANEAIKSKKWSLTPLFESKRTLDDKNALLHQLKDIACNQQDEKDLAFELKLSVKDRLAKIKEFVKIPTFQTTMLKYHNFNAFTYEGLKQLVANLLKLLGLYTPSYQHRFKNLKNATQERPSLAQMGSRYGLFSAAPRTGHSEPENPSPHIPASTLEPSSP
ncbi:hypothetical protein [Legionella yabuuchiae]|uniref:hypothetical protein n=1 Tax=Legionella yabuuchiae TaxID=376727 RepID=UPI0010548FB7|nr:hypothetical protein [Legionella yabuuchiae]